VPLTPRLAFPTIPPFSRECWLPPVHTELLPAVLGYAANAALQFASNRTLPVALYVPSGATALLSATETSAMSA